MSLRIDEHGFTCLSSLMGGETIRIEWQDILQVTAFKRDLFRPHIIDLAIETDSGCFEVAEEDVNGYEGFAAALGEACPGARAFNEWYGEAARPERRHEETTVFRRQG